VYTHDHNIHTHVLTLCICTLYLSLSLSLALFLTQRHTHTSKNNQTHLHIYMFICMRVCVCVCVDGRARQRTVLALPNQRSAVWWAAQWLWNGRYAWHATWYADDGWTPHGRFPLLNSKRNTYKRSNMHVKSIPLGVTFLKAQSSKLECLFCHVSVKRDVQALSF